MSYADLLPLLSRMNEIIRQAPAQLRALRKARRASLAHVKWFAWALRRNLVLVAGHHQVFPEQQVRGWVADYLSICALHLVAPPVVRVPRSLRGRLGKTIGGKPKRDAWGDEFPGEGLMAHAAARAEAP